MSGDKKSVTIKVDLPRCPACSRSVMYCDCGFTTEQDSREILNGKIPEKFNLSKREAKMMMDLSWGFGR